ncbi:MAG: hypothetical protein ACK4LB_01320 [Spirosomataceae bacterium]
MKNLCLTLALMCSVTFAFANDGDKKESPKMKETVEQNVNNNIHPSLEVECFGLSCGTACLELAPPDEDSDWGNSMYVRLWERLEKKFCGGNKRSGLM